MSDSKNFQIWIINRRRIPYLLVGVCIKTQSEISDPDTRLYLGRNWITFLGIQKTEYLDFRIRINSISDFEHSYLLGTLQVKCSVGKTVDQVTRHRNHFGPKLLFKFCLIQHTSCSSQRCLVYPLGNSNLFTLKVEMTKLESKHGFSWPSKIISCFFLWKVLITRLYKPSN